MRKVLGEPRVGFVESSNDVVERTVGRAADFVSRNERDVGVVSCVFEALGGRRAGELLHALDELGDVFAPPGMTTHQSADSVRDRLRINQLHGVGTFLSSSDGGLPASIYVR